jgi:hypothetical protein
MLWGSIIMLMSLPSTFPVYNFLHKHVFYFKYFRNLHFFLWMIVLPIIVLFACELLKLMLITRPKTRVGKSALTIFVVIFHGLVVAHFLRSSDLIGSTYVTAVLSLLFFVYFIWLKNSFLQTNEWVVLTVFFVLIVLQPIQTYYYFNRNADLFERTVYVHKPDLDHFLFPKGESADRVVSRMDYEKVKSADNVRPTDIYFSSRAHVAMVDNLNYDIFVWYLRNKFILYDRVRKIHQNEFEFKDLEIAFRDNLNYAYVIDEDVETESVEGNINVAENAHKIFGQSDYFKIIKFDVNSVTLKTNFNSKKFLVFNDTFSNSWQAFVNGKRVSVEPANYAYKGIWLPEGENVIFFRFGSMWRYVLNGLLICLFVFMLMGILYGAAKSNQRVSA